MRLKRNLIFSIAMIVLTLMMFVGASLAYFTSTDSGGNQVVDIGRFDFDKTSTTVGRTDFAFDATTIINFPPILRPTDPTAPDYQTQLARYLMEGDDEYFDTVCFPFRMSITNKSNTYMKLLCDVAVKSPVFADSVKFHMFDAAATEALTDISSSQYGKYADLLHDRVDNAILDGNPVLSGKTSEQVTSMRLSAANANTLAELERYILLPLSQGDNTKNLLIVMWLDHRAFKRAVEEQGKLLEDYLQFKVSIEITVTASNEV